MTQAVRQYVPRGAARQIFHERGDEVLLAGPAGTGKSMSALMKIHLMCLKNGVCPKKCTEQHTHWDSGLKALLLRKTLISLTSTGVQTYKEVVAKEALEMGYVSFYGGSRDEPPQYRYSNGSKIMLGGMDNPTKVMSSDYDVIFAQEATEFTPTDWEKCTSRLRRGRISFQQLIADCNPEQPDHWLKQRCDQGITKMLYAKHTDNPMLFDLKDGEYIPTPQGEAYLRKLNNLTGVRKLRLLGGIWAAAEGVIYEEFDGAIHVSNRKRLPYDWARVWGVDFGYTNPFCWQQWARDPDGRLWLEHEIYRSQRIVKDHAKQILQVVTKSDGVTWKYPRPEYIVCDHDAEDRATLERELGMPTRAAKKTVKPGIEAVKVRLAPAGDGLPKLFFLADSLVDRDEELHQAGLPLGTLGELPGYVWKPGPDGKPLPDEPLKQNDHSCLIAGTVVLTDAGDASIEDVRSGDFVWTRRGWRSVIASGMTSVSEPVFRVVLSTGEILTGTGSHPVWVVGIGWVNLDALRYGDRLDSWQTSKQSGSGESFLGAIRQQRIRQTVDTSCPESRTGNEGLSDCTKRFGLLNTGRSPRAITSIMSTSIRSIIQSTILCAYRKARIMPSTLLSAVDRDGISLRSVLSYLIVFGRSRKNGIDPKRVESFIPRTRVRHGSIGRSVARLANNAVTDTKHAQYLAIDSVPMRVSRNIVESPVLTTSTGFASIAERCSESINIPKRNPAPAYVLSVTALQAVPVYNLTVSDAHEFVANGVIVHNCDTLRYVVAEEDLKAKVRSRFL